MRKGALRQQGLDEIAADIEKLDNPKNVSELRGLATTLLFLVREAEKELDRQHLIIEQATKEMIVQGGVIIVASRCTIGGGTPIARIEERPELAAKIKGE